MSQFFSFFPFSPWISCKVHAWLVGLGDVPSREMLQGPGRSLLVRSVVLSCHCLGRLSFVIRIHAVHIMSSIARSSLWDTLLPWLLHYTCIGRDDAMPALTTRGPGLTDWH